MAAKRTKQEKKRQARRVASARAAPEGPVLNPVRRDAAGRAHLVTLSQPLFNDSWQNEVAAGAANTSHAIFSERKTAEAAVELGRSLLAATSKIAEGLVRGSAAATACHQGCAHCCYQSVGVSAVEVLVIYDYLKTHRTPAEFEAMAERVRSADAVTRGMPATERIAPELPCPLLENERCSVYEARPLACRGANSLDAAACESALKDPDVHAAFLDGSFSVPCFAEPFRTFHAVTAGMQLALSELHGLLMLPLELTAALRTLLDAPDAVSEQWLAGADPFFAARGGDNSDNPRIQKLVGKTGAA